MTQTVSSSQSGANTPVQLKKEIEAFEKDVAQFEEQIRKNPSLHDSDDFEGTLDALQKKMENCKDGNENVLPQDQLEKLDGLLSRLSDVGGGAMHKKDPTA